MTRVTLYTGGGLALLILWLVLNHRAQAITYAEPVKIPAVPKTTFIIDGPTIEQEPVTYGHGPSFDWIGDGDCGCVQPSGYDTVIIDSVKVVKHSQPGYYPVIPPYINIPPYLKGSLPLYQNPTMPDVPMYRAAPPSFWWGWKGMSRVIYTSDGATLRTGASNSLYQIWNGSGYSEGIKSAWAIFNPITSIKYNGQLYQLDASKSVGL